VEIIYNLTGKHAAPDLRYADRDDGVSQSSRSAIQSRRSWMGVVLDKGARFTDWSRRPLTERQIDYAIGDVTYLIQDLPEDAGEAAQDRARRLARPGDGKARRSRKLPQRSSRRMEADQGAQPQARCARPPEGARRMARSSRRRTRTSRAAASSATRRWPTSPATRPSHQADLGQGARAFRLAGRTTTSAAADAARWATRSRSPDEEMPSAHPRGAPLGKEGALVADLLKLLLKIRAARSTSPPGCWPAATTGNAGRGRAREPAILEGWRFEQFGRDALELVEGRLAFTVYEGKLLMTRAEIGS
jgi:ribonuclease D